LTFDRIRASSTSGRDRIEGRLDARTVEPNAAIASPHAADSSPGLDYFWWVCGEFDFSRPWWSLT